MQHIELSYNWSPHQPEALPRNRINPLRNPLMDLLHAVRECGSIGAAAKKLQLSYRHVWGELKRWELTLNQPLIVWEKGQSAKLTHFAVKLLWAERQAQARLSTQIESLQAELERTFSIAFKPDAHVVTLYASHDDALLRLGESSSMQSLHLDIRFCGSVDAIRALNEGRCEIAGFHTLIQPDPSSRSAKIYKPLLKPGMHKLIGFAKRTQGLLVAKGNPLQLHSLEDVVAQKARFVNRSLGTGTRLLLEELMLQHDVKPSQMVGFDHTEPSHGAVAARIASGQADVGLAIESVAAAASLDFVPIATENYWLACLKSALDTPAVVALRGHLQNEAWHQTLQSMQGYEINSTGQVQSLRKVLPWWTLTPPQPK